MIDFGPGADDGDPLDEEFPLGDGTADTEGTVQFVGLFTRQEPPGEGLDLSP